jgi:transcriptional regulator with XRE-family HTH domain
MPVAGPTFLPEVIGRDGIIQADRMTASLRITKIELARASGLSRDAVSKAVRLKAPATQARLRDVAEIINRALSWSGSVQQAFAWYRAQPLPSFGDATAEDLVKQGRAEAVKKYLSRIAVGGHA